MSITGDDCHYMVSNREWKDQYHQNHHVKVPGLNAITLNNLSWQGTASGDEACQGGGCAYQRSHCALGRGVLMSLITITVESFLITHEVISAKYSTERLQCPSSVSKCVGVSHAYMWDHMVIPPFPWKLARSTHDTLTKESFFSNHDALLFLGSWYRWEPGTLGRGWEIPLWSSTARKFLWRFVKPRAAI